jgi:hypothetical protein
VRLKVGRESKLWRKINRTGRVKQARDISSSATPRGSILGAGLETLDEHLIMMRFTGGGTVPAVLTIIDSAKIGDI